MKRWTYPLTVFLMVMFVSITLAFAAEPVKKLPYSKEELLTQKIRTSYRGDKLNLVAFPMGGIGSGCISLSGTGKLIDWEIFNYPNTGYQPRFTFLSVWAKAGDDEPVFKVLEGQLTERLDGPLYLAEESGGREMNEQGNGVGPQQTQAAGLPRMRNCRFEGKFPFAKVYLADKKLPVKAVIEGFSPFIPGNSRDASLPVAILNVTLKNPTDKKVKISLAANLQNTAGVYNQIIREPGFNALYMHDNKKDSNSIVLATPHNITTWQQNWQGGADWRDNFTCLQHFAATFAKTGLFDSVAEKSSIDDKKQSSDLKLAKDKNSRVGSIAVRFTLEPGQSRTVPFIISWYFPKITVPKGWWGKPTVTWTNYYATQWDSAIDVARYVLKNFDRLQGDTRTFQQTLFSSTLPGVVLEAISSQLSILKSPVLVRYPDGTLYGWEGTSILGQAGKKLNRRYGFGTCSHVYNYQQTIPYLFGDLQRSMLNNFFFNGMKDSVGGISFRMPAGPGAKINQKGGVETAADGQLGQICQIYRDWQICGDDKWLKKIWPKAKKALEFAFPTWDRDKDGLLERPHHNTLDLNFTTPETMCGSLYQAALLAGEKMARYLGDNRAADEYRSVFEKGKKNTDQKLFNGSYYQQLTPAPGRYQLGNGCISEQLHGQLYARMLGLEDIYNRENIHKALASLFEYNFIESFYDFINTNRVFALGGEAGIVIATWPKGGRPDAPLLYCDETMNGYEYQVAANLLYEGYILEGLAVIKAVRDRYDGEKRNPYCEFEWGNHYVRSLQNYSSLLALSGFRYSAVENKIRLAPKIYQKDFRVFFSVDSAWGLLSQKITENKQTIKIDVKKGVLPVEKINIKKYEPVGDVTIKFEGEEIKGKICRPDDESWNPDKMLTVHLNKPVVLKPNQPLIIELEFKNDKQNK